jgi:hypothetical protein
MKTEKTWWFLEAEGGSWLENEPHGTFTRDPNLAMKWPNEVDATNARQKMRHPLWCLKETEHAWVSAPAALTPLEGELLEALKRAEAFIRERSGGGETEFRETALLPTIQRAETGR